MEHPGSSYSRWLPACLQLFDSALPTGSYAHSFGLEGLAQAGELVDADDLLRFLLNEVADNLIHADLPVFREAWACVEAGNFCGIAALDQLATAMLSTNELRQAGARVGRQTWKLYGNLFADGSIESHRHASAGEFLGNYQAVVVLGLLSGIQLIPASEAMAAYSLRVVSNFTQACIKLLGFGPTQVQSIIHQLSPKVPSWVNSSLGVGIDEAGTIAPRWDAASASHEFAERRLYIS